MNTVLPIPEISVSTEYLGNSPIPVDRISELYRGEIFTAETARVARDRIHWMCSQCKGERVLDVGCSQGIASVLLAREGFNVTAIDTHPDSIAFARSEFALEVQQVQQRLTLVETDLASLPEQPGYDTIVLGEVIEHQAQPDRLMRAAKARLNPGGRLVVTTPFALHPHPDHKVSLFPRHLIELARDIDLAVTELEVDGDYMRCVMVASDVAGAQLAIVDLLRLTEIATLKAEQRLFSRLEERTEQLKKKSDAVRITQRKLAEATAALENERQSERDQVLAFGLERTRLSKHNDRLEKRLAEVTVALEKQRQSGCDAELAFGLQRARLSEQNERLEKSLAEAKAKLLASRATISYRLGSVLVHGGKSPRALLGLPGQLWSLRRDVLERRQLRERKIMGLNPVAATTTKRSALQVVASIGLAGLDVETLKTRVEAEGLATVKARLLAAAERIDVKIVAFRLLQLGKALSEAGRRDDEFELAEAALGVDSSDQTLRGFFWAAQRSRRFERAGQTILQLERLYGDEPSPEQKAILDKLRLSPAFQLSVLDLVVQQPRERLEGIAGRVCYVLHNSLPYSSGGYGTRSQGVASGLAAAGREVIVLTRPGFPVDIKAELNDADVPAEDIIDGIRYVRTLEPKRQGISMLQYVTKAADALERQMRDLRPEIVMSASNHVTAIPALIAARRLGLPFIYEVRGLWEITRSSREEKFRNTAAFAVQSLLEAKVAQLADHVFTLNEPMRKELEARGVPRAKIDLLPNSCDPDRFMPHPRDEALAAGLGIPQGVPVIGYVGTFVDYEGLDDLALACNALKQRGCKFRLMLVGNENASGTDRGLITEQILRIAEAGGMTDWLIMPGRVPNAEVESYYSLIDVAPFPRKAWPVCEMVSPMKPLEALAMEKAVLVSSVRALSEMIADGQTGRVFDKGSVASLADRLEELIAAPAQCRKLGRQGRKWVIAERNWRAIGEKVSSIMVEKIGV
jgi:glycosyltransferase involved in cell wall biosynthesis/cyclopropane fatty-acyl-phospholipid synthase-like methyltransferase